MFPKYKYFIADERYAEIARMLGLPASTTEEGVDSLTNAIVELGKDLGIKMSIKDQGVDENEFLEKVS